MTKVLNGRIRKAGKTAPRELRAPKDADSLRVLSREIDFRFHPSFESYCGPLTLAEILPTPDEAEAMDPVADRGTSVLSEPVRRICRTPLLTAAQERDCFLLLNYLRYRANALRASIDPSRRNRPLLERIEGLLNEATRVRQQIFSANFRLVVSIARKFVDRTATWDELISVGAGVLIYAIDKFDVGRGFRFSTYATHAIRRDFYRAAFQRRRNDRRTPLSSPELLAAIPEPKPDLRISDSQPAQMSALLELLEEELDPREQGILKARFGLGDSGEGQTLQEISTTQGICKERVRQLQHRAVEKLRALARDRGLFPEEWSELESTDRD